MRILIVLWCVGAAALTQGGAGVGVLNDDVKVVELGEDDVAAHMSEGDLLKAANTAAKKAEEASKAYTALPPLQTSQGSAAYAADMAKHQAARVLADKRATESQKAYQAATRKVEADEALTMAGATPIDRVPGFKVTGGGKEAHVVEKLGAKKRAMEMTKREGKLLQRVQKEEKKESTLTKSLKVAKANEKSLFTMLQGETQLRKSDESYEAGVDKALKDRLSKLETQADFAKVDTQAVTIKALEAQLSTKKKAAITGVGVIVDHQVATAVKAVADAGKAAIAPPVDKPTTTATRAQPAVAVAPAHDFNMLVVPGLNKETK